MSLLGLGENRPTFFCCFFNSVYYQALREAWHDYEAAGVVSVMAEWKASFWEEEYDIYTDTQSWRHK